MSDARDPTDHGGPNDPEFRVGRGKPARRRIATLIIGIVVFVFAVLLTIWLLGRSAGDVQGAAAMLVAWLPTRSDRLPPLVVRSRG